jgi:hypothetical protein
VCEEEDFGGKSSAKPYLLIITARDGRVADPGTDSSANFRSRVRFWTVTGAKFEGGERGGDEGDPFDGARGVAAEHGERQAVGGLRFLHAEQPGGERRQAQLALRVVNDARSGERVGASQPTAGTNEPGALQDNRGLHRLGFDCGELDADQCKPRRASRSVSSTGCCSPVSMFFSP